MSKPYADAEWGSAPRATVLTFALVALWSVPCDLGAQADVGPRPGAVSFRPAGGVALPAGELGDVLDAGASLGAGVSYHITRHLGLWGGADVQFMSGHTDDSGATFPDTRLLHAGIGGELTLFSGYDLRDDPDPTPFTTTFRIGVGISSLDTEDTLDGGSPAPVALDETYLSFQGGVSAGYQATRRVAVVAGSTAHLMLTDREDTRGLAAVSPEVEVFDVAWSIPVYAGVRITVR